MTLSPWLPTNSQNFCSNHPKSRKAIVTWKYRMYLHLTIICSNHPKSRKAIVTAEFCVLFFRQRYFQFQSPQKPKGDCDFNLRALFGKTPNTVPITPKAERRLWHIDECVNFANDAQSSNHPKSRKAIVTSQNTFDFSQFARVPITPKAERRLWLWTPPAKGCAAARPFQSPQKPKGDCDSDR